MTSRTVAAKTTTLDWDELNKLTTATTGTNKTTEDGPASEKRVLSRKEAVAMALGDPMVRSASETPLVVSRRALYAESAKGVLGELAKAGFPGIEEVGELRRRRLNYKAAVPVLVEWLPRARYLLLAEDIVRTLSVTFAKKLALPEFLRYFREPPFVEDPMLPELSEPEPTEEQLRWVIGNGLGIFAGPPVGGELIELALERKYGQARTQIVVSLPKTKDSRVGEVLMSLLDDPTVAAFAVEALGKMRFTEAREQIVTLLEHSDINVRGQAKKALNRIDGVGPSRRRSPR